MSITPKNLVKHTITPSSIGRARKGGYAFWGDPIVTWGDALYSWGSPFASFVNAVKHIISPINKVKN